MAINGYFEVDVHGEYFQRRGDKKELMPYKQTFRLPDVSKPLSTIVGKLLTPYLMKLDPKFDSVYTHFVDEVRAVGRKFDPNELPIRFQSKEQLRGFVKLHKLPVDVDDYADLGLLRDHVRLAKEEPEHFANATKKYAKKREEELALFDLNAGILGSTPGVPGGVPGGIPSEVPVAENKPTEPSAESILE